MTKSIKSSNQMFHYTRCTTPKRVMSLNYPLPRHCLRATQLLSKKCRRGNEPLATLHPIRPARDLNLRLAALETNVLSHDQLAGSNNIIFKIHYLGSNSNLGGA